MKTCSSCQEEKPLSEFHKHSGFKDGLNSRCKDCRCKLSSDYFQKNKSTILAKQRTKKSRRLYGLKTEDLSILDDLHKGKCAICKKETKLCIDHCHESKQVRGLLCATCNVGLGMFKDDPVLLENAIEYLAGRGRIALRTV